nr:hypothetical protein [Tanacetum cinerariifolium]
MSSLRVGELLISLLILVKSSSLLQFLILLATSSFVIDFIGVKGNIYSNNDGNPWLNFCSSIDSKIFTTCLFGLIWNYVLMDEGLGIFGVDEVAILGDLLYGIGFCGIPSKRAKAEYAGLVIELYVGGCGVKPMNLF